MSSAVLAQRTLKMMMRMQVLPQNGDQFLLRRSVAMWSLVNNPRLAMEVGCEQWLSEVEFQDWLLLEGLSSIALNSLLLSSFSLEVALLLVLVAWQMKWASGTSSWSQWGPWHHRRTWEQQPAAGLEALVMANMPLAQSPL